MKKKILFFVALFGFFLGNMQSVTAQVEYECENGKNPVTGEDCANAIITSVPFLRINPDARSGALGDAGLATGVDPNAMHFNASKLAFANQPVAISATYTPWLRAIGLSDVYLAYLTGYVKLDELQTVGFGLRFFSMGDINFTDTQGNPLGTGSPTEFEISGAYARNLTEKLAVALTGKFVYSNLAGGQTLDGVEIKAGKIGAADISFTYKSPIKLGNTNSDLTVAAAFTNLGTKITYTNSANKDFIPTNMGIGAGWKFDLDNYNTLAVLVDFNKLLVPTPQTDNSQRDLGAIEGMLTSFGDAPGKGAEELKEVMTSIGVEYWYDNQFAVRAGYFGEHYSKGNRKYFTVGLGLKYNVFGLDLSYLVPSGAVQNNPLANTLRFTLSYLIDGGIGETLPES